MKNLDLGYYDVAELDAKSIRLIEGGNFWGASGIAETCYSIATGRSLIGDTRKVLISAYKDYCQSDSNYQLMTMGH